MSNLLHRRTISNKGECVTRHKDRVVVRRYMSIFINVMIFLVPRNAKCHNGSGEYIPENVLNVLECNIQPFDVGYFCHFVREGFQKKNVPFSSLLLLRGPATPPPFSSPVGN